MKEKIIIIGGKGAAVAVAELIDNADKQYNAPYEMLGFCIDDPALGDNINGFPILCRRDELLKLYEKCSDVKFLFLLYKPSCMADRVALLKDMHIPASKFTNIIHPTAYIAKSAVIGTGNVFTFDSFIDSNTKTGNFNLFNYEAIVCHDSQVGDCNFFAPQVLVGSEIKIGDGNFFGLHSVLREHVTVGDYNVIGMGAGIIKSVESHKTMIGFPAREL